MQEEGDFIAIEFHHYALQMRISPILVTNEDYWAGVAKNYFE
jgi:hypothetical protein